LNANGIYWDFEGRGPLAPDMTQLSEVEEYTGFITRHKALYFEAGVTGATKIGSIASTHKSSSFSLSMFICFKSTSFFPPHPSKLDFFEISAPGASSSLVIMSIS